MPTAAPIKATPIATPIATWSDKCEALPLPQGWTWYQDASLPFHVASPPTWRTGAFEYIPDGSGALSSPSRIHVVDFFGPGSVGQARSSGKMRSDMFPPVITIEVSVGSLANWRAQPIPICIGATAVTLYVFMNSEGDVERAAVLRFGTRGYAYTFEVASHAETTARDGQLFVTARAMFAATGH